jgi:hypothetical protein
MNNTCFAVTLITSAGGEEALGRELSIGEMQKMVGGYIHFLHATDDNHLLVINTEGLPKGLPVNLRATQLVRSDLPLHGVRGNAIVVTKESYYR